MSPYLRIHLVLVYVFLFLPIAVLVVLSFNRSGLPTSWVGFTTDWYGEMWRNEFLYSRAATIYGGTAEVQRNIIARRLLDLGSDE